VIARRRQLLRATAIVLLLLFSISSTHALALVTPPCAQCPPDCPMHAKKLGCHHGASVVHETAGDQSRNQPRPEPGLHCTGCTQHADRPVLSDQPVVLPAPASGMVAPQRPRRALATFCRPAEVALDPPFHPPRLTDPSI